MSKSEPRVKWETDEDGDVARYVDGIRFGFVTASDNLLSVEPEIKKFLIDCLNRREEKLRGDS